jgi:hypothetical protein
MRGLTKKVVDDLRTVLETLRVSQYYLVLFNIDNLGQRIEYFHKLVRKDKADGFHVITLLVQDSEFERIPSDNRAVAFTRSLARLMCWRAAAHLGTRSAIRSIDRKE